MTTLNPAILKWARESAGLSLADAAARLDLGAARGVSGADRLAAIEAGEFEPPRSLLLKMADRYRRPLLTFFLTEPPRRGDRGQDFRTLPEATPPTTDAIVDAIVRDIRMRQSIVSSLLEDDDDAKPVEFIGVASESDGAAKACSRLIQILGFDLREFRSQPTVPDAFRYLRRRVEAVGVFVLLMGNLGSHHSNVDANVFRGFAIADPIAPFIVINENDARGAWSFTLLHEFVHLMLGDTGISGSDSGSATERFCDQIAGMVLLPEDDARKFQAGGYRTVEALGDAVDAFAQTHRISASMTAYRLYKVGILDRGAWLDLHRAFRQRWDSEKARRRDRRSSDDRGPTYYVVRRHRIGEAMLSLVRRSVESGELSSTKAARALGVRPGNVYPLLRSDVATAAHG